MKKKLIALTLVFAMIFSLTACSKSENNNTPDPTPTTVADNSQGEDQDNNQGGGDVTPESNYTLNYALATFPTNWNPHQHQTATDSDDMLGFLTAGFYFFDYNDTLDGYKLTPYTITGDPVDVTADYAGQYGLESGAASRAWKLTLRDDLKWDDGTPITANDYVTSAKLLLNPDAQNYRADSLYSGSLAIVNAKDYLYQGQYAYSEVISGSAGAEEYIALDSFVISDDGTFTFDGMDVAVNLNDGGNWGSNGLADYYGAGGYEAAFTGADGTDLYATVLEPAADEDGYVKVTQEVYEALLQFVAVMHGYENVEAYAEATTDDADRPAGDYAYLEWQELCFFGKTYPSMDFSEVGIFATSDTELVLVLEKELSGFYLHYALTDSWLIKEDLYTSCMSMNNDVYTNSYGTSAETTASYGPYSLSAFQADKEYTLVKNPNFFDQGENLWQTTSIIYSYVPEASTRLEMFLSGQLDSYALSADDMETYASSDYTYYTTTPSTYYIALNPDMAALTSAQEALGANYNKTILTVKEFRQALSYALDRAAFALATSPTNNPAFGLYSDLIICDPEAGTGYRSTEEAKQVIVDFWGLADEVGEGKLYATLDDAIDSITGYNLEMAKEYFGRAYDIAIADGLMKEGDTIQIKIGLPNSTSNFYAKGYEFLVNCYTDAVKGTALEGKLTFTMDDTLGNGFGDALRANNVDMLFGVGWSGSALDPYNLIEAYTSEQYRYNKHWDTSVEMLTINLDGVDYTASILDWTNTLNGADITITAADGTTKAYRAGASDDVGDQRFQILVALERAILATYEMIPMIDASSAGLKGMQVEYYTEDYIYGVGRGGERYLSYNYTDEEWTEFISSQGGKLNYN